MIASASAPTIGSPSNAISLLDEEQKKCEDDMFSWLRSNVSGIHPADAIKYSQAFYRAKQSNMARVARNVNRDSQWLVNLEIDPLDAEDIIEALCSTGLMGVPSSVAEREAKEQAERNAATAEIAAMKAKAEKEAKEIKAKAEREAKEQADRVNASTAEMKAKAEREIAEMKAKAEKVQIQQPIEQDSKVKIKLYKDSGLHRIRSGPSLDTKEVGNFSNGNIIEVYSTTNLTNGFYRLSDGRGYTLAKGDGFSWTMLHRVRITGATGGNIGDINGEYEATSELKDGMPIYVKTGNRDKCLVFHKYSESALQWHVRPIADKNNDDNCTYCEVPIPCLPQECPAGKWRVWDGKTHETQPAVTISSVV